jgi:hypothetical protein
MRLVSIKPTGSSATAWNSTAGPPLLVVQCSTVWTSAVKRSGGASISVMTEAPMSSPALLQLPVAQLLILQLAVALSSSVRWSHE